MVKSKIRKHVRTSSLSKQTLIGSISVYVWQQSDHIYVYIVLLLSPPALLVIYLLYNNGKDNNPSFDMF